jgi:MFS family permease
VARATLMGMNAARGMPVPLGIVGIFHKIFEIKEVPTLSRASYRLELSATLLFSMALALIEGGTIGVIAKKAFGGVLANGEISLAALNAAVAVIAASGEMANVMSFAWAWVAHGRQKMAVVNALQIAVGILVGATALVPLSMLGLVIITALVLLARVCWSGIVTVRPSIWRTNYPRQVRAKVVGRFAAVQVVTVAVVGLVTGVLMDAHPDAFRVVAPLGAVMAVWACVLLRQVPVRGEKAELRQGQLVPRPGLLDIVKLVYADKMFARFQLWMFILGLGNLMLTFLLIIVLSEQFKVGYFLSILITVGLIQLAVPLFIPMWARLLDRAHVVYFRSIHSWSFVIALLVFALGSWFGRIELMMLGAVLQAVGLAGGSIAWNIGHHDFAPPSETSRYMALHVTLNGVRGLLAPLMALNGYEWLRGRTSTPGAWMFLASAAICMVGAAGFVTLRRRMEREKMQLQRVV